MKTSVFNFCLCLMFLSCSKEKVATVSEYSKWINNPDNGLLLTRRINGLQISVKYLPSEYLDYKELQSDKKNDSKRAGLDTKYKNTLTFLITFGPDESKGNKNDIMFNEISNYKEYAERLLTMNFELEKDITLKTGNLELKPVLSALENTYGLSKNRNIVLAFALTEEQKKEMENADELDLIYTDELFDMGTLHFNFLTRNLHQLPQISQLKNER